MPLGNVSGATSSLTNNRLVTRLQFAPSWIDGKRSANWVAWRLRASDLGSALRSDFQVVPVIPTPSPSDNANSGYDRGNLCPSGDRTNTTANNFAVLKPAGMRFPAGFFYLARRSPAYTTDWRLMMAAH